MQAHFEQLFQRIKSSSWTPPWLRSSREDAFDRFQQLGWPERHDENWKYTSTRALAKQTFEWQDPAKLSEIKLSRPWRDFIVPGASVLAFVNGRFDRSLSSPPEQEGVSFRPVEEVLEQPSTLIQRLVQKEANSSSMEALNLAFFSSGVVLHVARGVRVAKPLQVLYINTEASGAAQLICPRSVLLLEENASATLVESYFSYLENHFTSSLSKALVKPGARLEMLLEKVLSSQSQHLSQLFCDIERDAEVKTFTLTLGGSLARTQQEFRLQGEGAEAAFDGLYIGRGQSHIDNQTMVQHLAPHTRSTQVFKGILHDQSRAVFDGRINIAKHAQQTQAQQLNKNLLMSESAEVDTKPQLQIDADDVRCSHGATVGRLDRDELFYLQSRGISRAEGETMLAKAFVRDVISRMKNDLVEQRLESLLVQYGGMDV